MTEECVKEIYKNKGYELLTEYINSNTVLFIKDKEGYIYSNRFNDFKQNKTPTRFHTNNPYTIQNIKLWMKTNATGYELLSTKYTKATEKLLFMCSKGHEFEMSWSSFNRGQRCPYCSIFPRKIELGINTIWDTDRWMCDLGVSEEDAKNYSKCSGKKIKVICPNCGKEKYIVISKIYNRKSIGCSCSDHISYPEKILISLLDQLDVKYEREYTPKWDGYKRYDFYLPDYNCIIECNGEQHYKYTGLKRTLQEEQENDRIKEQLALQSGIDNYIILDCRKSELEYIKHNIFNSILNELFDLSMINWKQCNEFALKNRTKEICDYWSNKEECETVKDLSEFFNVSNVTIRNHLKKGSKLGWCDYNPIEESKKSQIHECKPVLMLKDNIILNVFKSSYDLQKQFKLLYGVDLDYKSIQDVCRGLKNTYNGYEFKYITQKEYQNIIKKGIDKHILHIVNY